MRTLFGNLIAAFGLLLTAMFGARSADACPTLGQCEALSALNKAPACCCLLWDRFVAPPLDQATCLVSNGYTTYSGSGTPPASCSDFQTDPESPIGSCPGAGTQCTNQVLGNVTCKCKGTQVWEGDGCVDAPLPVLPTCSVPNTLSDLDQHVCGSIGCAPSDLPFPAPKNGANFDGLANPMAACCGRGWGENDGPASKFDCLEAMPTPGSTFKSFYLAGNGTANNATTAGLKWPNQIFMLDKNGEPLSGFYTQSGVRCNYRKASDHTHVQLTKDQQMEVFAAALQATPIAIPTPFPGGVDAEVDPLCCTLIVFALERQCPQTNGKINDAVTGKELAKTIPGAPRRCTAAKNMKLDYGIYDLCDLNLVHRNRFRPSTSYGEEDPKYTTVEMTSEINVKNLIQVFYPPPAPGMAPSCPIAPIAKPPIWRENFSGGMCRIYGETL